MIRRMPEITADQENFRLEEFVPGQPRFQMIKRDPVEPVPVGTCVAMVFRVTGYDSDCDGSLMARLAQVDWEGESSGWEPTHLGLYPDSSVVVDGPSDLHDISVRSTG